MRVVGLVYQGEQMFYTRKVKTTDQGCDQGGARGWSDDVIEEETLMEVGDSVYVSVLRRGRTPDEAVEIAQASMLDALEWAMRVRAGMEDDTGNNSERAGFSVSIEDPGAWGAAYADRFLASEYRRRGVFVGKVLPLLSMDASSSSTASYWSREWAEAVMRVAIDRLASISAGDLCPPVPGGVVLTPVEVSTLRSLASGECKTLAEAIKKAGGTYRGRALATQRERIALALQESGMFTKAGQE